MRRVVAVALALIVAILALASHMTALWQMWVTSGLMIGLATGVTAKMLGATVATRWFTKKLGPIIGVQSARVSVNPA
ncbi:hypothetical protein [Bradyrhizobium sp. Cp5.3]|uniref:hypothetical protein n=1 Tax=Bradyrhizobium sp. Cp5.3 TaxID=443598 RepID=UPI000406F774|nr:hypothetical protein [Bradyrhizobium sp. Cp5.3]